MATFQPPEAQSTTVTGANTEATFGETGAYQVLITLDSLPTAGDEVTVGFYVSIDEGATQSWAWSALLDNSSVVDEAWLSPVVPITDIIWDQLRSDATIAGAGVDWHYQIIKVADLAPA